MTPNLMLIVGGREGGREDGKKEGKKKLRKERQRTEKERNQIFHFRWIVYHWSFSLLLAPIFSLFLRKMSALEII